MVNIQILQSDPAYPLLDALKNRNSKNIVEISSTLYNLIKTLHKTSTSIRPTLNGNSRKVIAENLNISKGLISQYISIHQGIQSPTVQKAIIEKNIGVIRAYYISKSRGKNQEETEKIQLQKINEIINYRKKGAVAKIRKLKEEVKNDTTKDILSINNQYTIKTGPEIITKCDMESEGDQNKTPSHCG